MYLGFMIYANDLKMDPKMIIVILGWPTPKNFGELRSFHGISKAIMPLKKGVLSSGILITCNQIYLCFRKLS